MEHRRMIIATLAATALVASGCGGSGSSKSLTSAELTAQANAICKGLHTQLAALSMNSANNNDVKEPAQIYLHAAAFEHTMLAELEKLNPPASLADDWKQLVAGMGTLANDSTKYAEYTKAKNVSAAQTLATSFGAVKQRTHAAVRRAGFTECAVTF